MLPDKKAQVEQRATYVGLTGFFWLVFAHFARRRGHTGADPNLRALDLALLGLSSARLGRLVAFDLIMDPLRAPFTETVPDESGAGEAVVPRGSGWRRAIGEMISCPICAGTWIAAGLVYGLEIAPRPTRVFLAIMGSMGLSELLNALIEALSWVAQAARKKAST